MDPVLSRYPFLPEAGDEVADLVGLQELLTDRAYEPARRRGRDRAVQAVEDGILEVPEATGDAEVLTDLLSYAVARVLVSATGDDYVVRRHGLAEGERVKAHLRSDPPALVLRVAAALGVPVEHVGGSSYEIHFSDYLRHAAAIREQGWKLINQPLQRGIVTLDQHRLARLLQAALQERIEAELPRPVPPELREPLADAIEALEEAAKERKGRFQMESFGEVDRDAFPPCMQHIIGQLQSGVNVSHSGRFAVAAFLSNIGMTADEILDVFSQTPDFNEDIARYQVEHIAGTHSGREYTTPGCDTMKTNGVCYDPDRWCNHIRDDGTRSVTNPLSYYRWALKRRDWAERQAKREAAGEDADEGDEDEAEPPGLDPEEVPESIRAQTRLR